MSPLSVVILTFNEERNIGRCLESVRPIADDIIIIDSLSTDATESICLKFGATFIKRPWEGFSPAKNFGNAQARHDHILSLDADEAVSPELQKSIVQMKTGNPAKAYRFNRLNNFAGQWIRHGGWYPDSVTRIFDRQNSKWVGAVHEQLDGFDRSEIKSLPGDCLHYSYYSVDELRVRSRKYADLGAQKMLSAGKRPKPLNPVLHAATKFIRDYIIRAGFLDGRNGLAIARINAQGTFRKYRDFERIYAEYRKNFRK
jgi:glycosyltransferase involved in cell wall biosynthesis